MESDSPKELLDINRCSVNKAWWLGKGFYGYKKVINNSYDWNTAIIKLFIPTVSCKQLPNPKNTLTRNGVINKNYAKFRCNGAFVVEGRGISAHRTSFTYAAGQWVFPKDYDVDSDIICSDGIHFFLTPEAAELYVEIFPMLNIREMSWKILNFYNENGGISRTFEFADKGTYKLSKFRGNGSLKYVENYRNNQLNGEWFEYFPKDVGGGIHNCGQHSNGYRVGIWHYYDSNGNVTERRNHDIDYTNVINPKDIELVMSQVEACSYAVARDALIRHRGDIVNAIMELTI